MMSFSPKPIHPGYPSPTALGPTRPSPLKETILVKESIWVQMALESLIDGVLIVTPQKTCIHANQIGRRLCSALADSARTKNRSVHVPQAIWQVCQALIDCYTDVPHPVTLESEIVTEAVNLRIRVRWFEEQAMPQGHLLVILEDLNQSRQNQAIAEAERYALTPRQAEVWLLRQAGYTYQKIARTLYITRNTVHRHLKETYAKRRRVLSQET